MGSSCPLRPASGRAALPGGGLALSGGVAVEHATRADLLGQQRPELAARIATEGQGAALLAARGPDGHWGRGFYAPKWTCSHYTLLELRALRLPPTNPAARLTVALILQREVGRDGGLNPSRTVPFSDVCVAGMALRYAAWFGGDPSALAGLTDWRYAAELLG
ncbi:MAG TPA: hypothetical protein VES95_03765 [Dermatophilaceae bacterium]|nr:hypothetical protein [Dermatophilaceae bacterium]